MPSVGQDSSATNVQPTGRLPPEGTLKEFQGLAVLPSYTPTGAAGPFSGPLCLLGQVVTPEYLIIYFLSTSPFTAPLLSPNNSEKTAKPCDVRALRCPRRWPWSVENRRHAPMNGQNGGLCKGAAKRMRPHLRGQTCDAPPSQPKGASRGWRIGRSGRLRRLQILCRTRRNTRDAWDLCRGRCQGSEFYEARRFMR